MFRKILVCSDLSPASDLLIQCAQELKGIGMEEVVLIHVIYVANPPGLGERLAQEARPAVERQKKVLEDQGLRVTAEMPWGLPARTLLEMADSHNVSAILIGSHGKGMLGAVTAGSVSGRLLQQSNRPVLLASNSLLEGGKSDAPCRKLFDRVLFPTDFSETAERALDYLGKIAQETGCLVSIQHIIEEKNADPAENASKDEAAYYLLEAKKRRLERVGAAAVTIDLLHGRPADEIIASAKTGNFSLLVMGGQGKGFLKQVFLGSVANEVARKADVPLLLIPANHDSSFG